MSYRRLSILALLAVAPFAFTQQMQLTGVYNQNNWGGAYVSPYLGTVNGSPVLIICDDYTTDVSIGQTWLATPENADNVDNSVKFLSGYPGHTQQQTYNAAAWLANGLLANLNNQTLQIDYSYAIWNLFDPNLVTLNGQSPYGPDGGASGLMSKAFSATSNGPVFTNVTVFTPKPTGASQEYLVVNTPEPRAMAILGCDLLALAILGLFLSRDRAKPLIS